jgi:hypothetical protein
MHAQARRGVSVKQHQLEKVSRKLVGTRIAVVIQSRCITRDGGSDASLEAAYVIFTMTSAVRRISLQLLY